MSMSIHTMNRVQDNLFVYRYLVRVEKETEAIEELGMYTYIHTT